MTTYRIWSVSSSGRRVEAIVPEPSVEAWQALWAQRSEEEIWPESGCDDIDAIAAAMTANAKLVNIVP
jgi:hypothetical protein